MRGKLRSVIRLLCILIGVGILLYPSVSTYLSEKNGSRATGSYDGLVEQQNEAARQAILQEAIDYNRLLAEDQKEAGLPLTDELGRPACRDTYWDILNLSGNGMMGYIVLPTLGETIPIYHSTEESVLQVGMLSILHSLWADRLPMQRSLVIEVCPQPACLPIWIRLRLAIASTSR